MEGSVFRELVNYYEVLGIDREATIREIKDAYFKKLFTAFYEVCNNAKTTTTFQTLKDINDAYEVFKDADGRQEYDNRFFKNIVFMDYNALYEPFNNCTKAENEVLRSECHKILSYLDEATRSENVQNYFKVPMSEHEASRIMSGIQCYYYSFIQEDEFSDELGKISRQSADGMSLGGNKKEDAS